MKRVFTGFLIALTMNLLAVFACAAEPPVIVTHTLTNYSEGPSSLTLDYSLHVENTGDTPLTDLSLSLVPRPPFVATTTVVDVGSLAPKQSTDVTVSLVSRFLLGEDHFQRLPLSWAGECLNAGGKLLEFPVKSRPGGAR